MKWYVLLNLLLKNKVLVKTQNKDFNFIDFHVFLVYNKIMFNRTCNTICSSWTNNCRRSYVWLNVAAKTVSWWYPSTPLSMPLMHSSLLRPVLCVMLPKVGTCPALMVALYIWTHPFTAEVPLVTVLPRSLKSRRVLSLRAATWSNRYYKSDGLLSRPSDLCIILFFLICNQQIPNISLLFPFSS